MAGSSGTSPGTKGTGVFIPSTSVMEAIQQRNTASEESRRHSLQLDLRPGGDPTMLPGRREVRRFSMDSAVSAMNMRQGAQGPNSGNPVFGGAKNGSSCSARLLAAYAPSQALLQDGDTATAAAGQARCSSSHLGSSFFAPTSIDNCSSSSSGVRAQNFAALAAPVQTPAVSAVSASIQAALPVPTSSTFHAAIGVPPQQSRAISPAVAQAPGGFNRCPPKSQFQQQLVTRHPQQQQQAQPQQCQAPNWVPSSMPMQAAGAAGAHAPQLQVPPVVSSALLTSSLLEPAAKQAQQQLQQLQLQQQQGSQALPLTQSCPLPKLGAPSAASVRRSFAEQQQQQLLMQDSAVAGFDQGELLLTEHLARLLEDVNDTGLLYSQPVSPECSACQLPTITQAGDAGSMLLAATVTSSPLNMSQDPFPADFVMGNRHCASAAHQDSSLGSTVNGDVNLSSFMAHQGSQQQRHDMCMAAVATALTGGNLNSSMSMAAEEKLQQLLAVQQLQLELQCELLQLLPCSTV